jgi:hypothetical protein
MPPKSQSLPVESIQVVYSSLGLAHKAAPPVKGFEFGYCATITPPIWLEDDVKPLEVIIGPDNDRCQGPK